MHPYTAVIAFHSIYVLLGILAVLINAVVIYCVRRLNSLHKNRWLILPVALLCADTLLSFGYALVAGVTIDQIIRVKPVGNITVSVAVYSNLECVSLNVGLVLGSVLDQLIALSIAIERLLAIGFPVWYHHHSHKLIKYLLLFDICVSVVISSLSFVNVDPTDAFICTSVEGLNPTYRASYYVLLVIVCVLAVTVYCIVLVATWVQNRRVKRLEQDGAASSIAARRLIKQLQVTKVVTIIIAAYIVTTLPSYLLMCALQLTLVDFISKFGLEELRELLLFGQLMISLNTVINSFVYIWRNPDLRKEISQLCNKFLKNTITPANSQPVHLI